MEIDETRNGEVPEEEEDLPQDEEFLVAE